VAIHGGQWWNWHQRWRKPPVHPRGWGADSSASEDESPSSDAAIDILSSQCGHEPSMNTVSACLRPRHVPTVTITVSIKNQ